MTGRLTGHRNRRKERPQLGTIFRQKGHFDGFEIAFFCSSRGTGQAGSTVKHCLNPLPALLVAVVLPDSAILSQSGCFRSRVTEVLASSTRFLVPAARQDLLPDRAHKTASTRLHHGPYLTGTPLQMTKGWQGRRRSILLHHDSCLTGIPHRIATNCQVPPRLPTVSRPQRLD